MIVQAWQRVQTWVSTRFHRLQDWFVGRVASWNVARWLGASIIVCALAVVALGQFDGLLRGMHVPGRAAGGIADLSGPITKWAPDDLSERSLEVVDTWRRHAEEVGDRFADGRSIAALFVVVDSLLFVPAYLLLLALLFCVALPRLDPAQRQASEYAKGVFKLVNGWWGGVLVGLAVADVVENVCTWLVVDEAWGGGADPSLSLLYFLKLATTLKWLLALLAFVFLGLVAAILARPGVTASVGERGYLRRRLEPVTRVRLQLVLLVAFAASLLLPDQGWDVPRRWDWWTGSIAVLVTFVYAYFSWDIADRLIGLSDINRKGLSLKRMAAAGAALFAAGLLMLWFAPAMPWGVMVPGILMVLIAAGSRIVAWDEQDAGSLPPAPEGAPDEGEIRQSSKALAHLLAAGPPVALGLSLVRSAAGQLVYTSEERWRMGILLAVGLVLPWLGFLLSAKLRSSAEKRESRDEEDRGDGLRWAILGGGAAALALLAVAMAVFDDFGWRVATGLGAVGIVASFAIVASMIGGLAVRFAERAEPPALFKVLSLRRIPVLALILIWVVVAGKFDDSGFHDVRVTGRPGNGPAQGVTAVQVFDRWLENRSAPTYSDMRKSAARARSGRAPVTVTRPAIPMTFTAASGGGIRAAYWTDLVLDCIYERKPSFLPQDSCDNGRPYGSGDKSEDLFAMSGISGGSLGLVAYASELVRKQTAPYQRDWVNERLDEDFLSPTLGWELFVESARALLRFDPPYDRAAIMEKSWERAWQDEDGDDLLTRGLRATWRESQHVPLLMLNGSSVNDGCRFETSVLNAGPPTARENCLSLQPFERAQSEADAVRAFGATLDLMDFLCRDQDVALSTAALLSARFPFVSPPGRLSPRCADGDTTYIVDGGYLESSGASPLVELWNAVEPMVQFYDQLGDEEQTDCVVPFYVQIDNGYEIPDVPPRDQNPGDLFSPRTAQHAARGAWLAGAKEAAAIAFRKPFVAGQLAVMQGGWPLSNRYQHVYPRAHPGVQAPLGWALSPAARADLRTQLDSVDNLQAIGEVREWSQGTVTCAPSLDSADYEPVGFPLEGPIDLSETWRVSDTESMLSLFRNRDDTSISIGFLPSGLEEDEVADRLSDAVETQVGTIPVVSTFVLGGLDGTKVAFPGCEVGALNVEVLPTHLVSPTECSSEGYRDDPTHDVFSPEVGGGLRLGLAPGQAAESFVLDYQGAVVVVTITAPSETSFADAEATAATVLTSLSQ